MNVKYPTGLGAHKIWSVAYSHPLPNQVTMKTILYGTEE